MLRWYVSIHSFLSITTNKTGYQKGFISKQSSYSIETMY